MSQRQLLVTCVSILALLAAGCAKDAPAPTITAGHGKEFPASSTPHIAIKKGERFSVVVDENASVGDMWQLKQPPDATIAKTENQDYVSGSPSGSVGGGGKRYFVFTASRSGESAITLYDCYRGCQGTQDKQRSRTYEIHLSVS
jgi:inhibitor of cysteine peptidase